MGETGRAYRAGQAVKRARQLGWARIASRGGTMHATIGVMDDGGPGRGERGEGRGAAEEQEGRERQRTKAETRRETEEASIKVSRSRRTHAELNPLGERLDLTCSFL